MIFEQQWENLLSCLDKSTLPWFTLLLGSVEIKGMLSCLLLKKVLQQKR
jgi:hypothetical protein